jgi:hypothetical protein
MGCRQASCCVQQRVVVVVAACRGEGQLDRAFEVAMQVAFS